MTDFENARHVMVESQLRTINVHDKPLLSQVLEVPRELFVPDERKALAYADVAHDLGAANGRCLADAGAFAKLVQLAGVTSDDIVLDIACGTGYSTAVLAGLANAVVALEDDQGLVEQADANLSKLEIGNAAVLKGELTAGVPAEAPFDVIVIEGEIEQVPQTLLDQLKEGGRLVAAVKRGPTASAELYVRAEGEITSRREFDIHMPELLVFRKPVEFAL